MVEVGVPGQSHLYSDFGKMQLHVDLMGNHHPLHQARDNLFREEVLAIPESWDNAMSRGGHCTPVFSSFSVLSMCWHSVSGQQSLCAGAALWGSGGHPASISTNRGDLGQVCSLSKSGCQVYQTGTDWLDSECSSHDPQDINSLGLS